MASSFAGTNSNHQLPTIKWNEHIPFCFLFYLVSENFRMDFIFYYYMYISFWYIMTGTVTQAFHLSPLILQNILGYRSDSFSGPILTVIVSWVNSTSNIRVTRSHDTPNERKWWALTHRLNVNISTSDKFLFLLEWTVTMVNGKIGFFYLKTMMLNIKWASIRNPATELNSTLKSYSIWLFIIGWVIDCTS